MRGIPKSEENIIGNLVKAEIISEPTGETIKKMKGFRNFLVHRYGKLDDEIAYQNIKTNIGDFERIEQEITGFLKEKPRQ